MSPTLRWSSLYVLIAALAAEPFAIEGSRALAQLWERYLSGYHGPYRGRVIDAETKKPLEGAVVVAVWNREVVWIFQTNTEFWQAREVLTDSNGEFVLDAEDIELKAPSRTLRPTLVIFYPGYGSFPRFGRVTRGLVGGNFEGPGSDVELPPLKTVKERIEKLISPYELFHSAHEDLSDAPYKYTPNLVRLINAERVSLGLQPYRSQEKR
jgi:hypothetical protein